MAVSENLGIPLLTEAMLQKTIAVNLALNMMEKAISERLVIDTSTAISSGFDLYVPYDDTNDLSDRSGLHCIVIELAVGASANFDLIHPEKPHLFILDNQTTRVCTVFTNAIGGASVTVPAGARQLLFCDGANMIKNNFTLENVTMANDCAFSFYGSPEADQVMGRILIGRTTIFPANFSGAVGHVGVNPLATKYLLVYDDASQIGTIEINTFGGFTFTTVGGTSKTVLAGSLLELRNDSNVDSLIYEIHAVLPASVVIPQPFP